MLKYINAINSTVALLLMLLMLLMMMVTILIACEDENEYSTEIYWKDTLHIKTSNARHDLIF